MEWDEEDYFGDRRKELKTERKIASATDRSKDKITDRNKQKESFMRPTEPGSQQGRVIGLFNQGWVVAIERADKVDAADKADAANVTQQQTYNCTLRGTLKQERGRAKNLVAVGDLVWFVPQSLLEGVILAIEPRKTCLMRADQLSQRRQQIIATNIDQVLITTSVVRPCLKPPLVDRYIIAAHQGQMKPLVVINKIDLLHEDPGEEALYHEFMQAYTQAGIPLLPVSATTQEGIEALREAVRGRTCVFAGQSGVGKSSLINLLTGMELRTGETVQKTGKGSHTTSQAELIPLPGGGWCVDTPGIQSFGIWELKQEDVEGYFPDIFTVGHRCKYADCSHTGEPGCAVWEALESGEIPAIRFDSYCALIGSIAKGHRRR